MSRQLSFSATVSALTMALFALTMSLGEFGTPPVMPNMGHSPFNASALPD